MEKLYKTYEIGQKIGKIKLLEEVYKLDNKRKRKYWKCKCLRCGKIFIAREDSIKCGDQKTCGCLRKHTRHLYLLRQARKERTYND